ncbi:MAG: 50S ribosomal protein P1 [Candidatus Woesearchaeota archaeon]|nr:50S ribosomal protein P1 [Candidatus Woesearchaeota archaeon]
MEYIYAAMLIHKAGKKIDEPSLKKVLEAAGVKVDEAKVKAMVATLEGVDIEKAIEMAQTVSVAAAPSAPGKEEKKADKEEEKKTEEQAAAGLGALFG